MTEQEAKEQLEALCEYDLSLDEEIAVDMGIKALEEIQQYRAIGGTPELIAKVINFLGNDEDNSIINDLELLNQYRAFGTVEELKDAREKQIAKKVIFIDNGEELLCPCCGIDFMGAIQDPDHDQYYCFECGQALDWGNEDAE